MCCTWTMRPPGWAAWTGAPSPGTPCSSTTSTSCTRCATAHVNSPANGMAHDCHISSHLSPLACYAHMTHSYITGQHKLLVCTPCMLIKAPTKTGGLVPAANVAQGLRCVLYWLGIHADSDRALGRDDVPAVLHPAARVRLPVAARTVRAHAPQAGEIPELAASLTCCLVVADMRHDYATAPAQLAGMPHGKTTRHGGGFQLLFS